LCGIAGFTTADWSPDAQRIEEATATLFHRGPNQQGTFRSRLCSLGATRLKILDLDSGDQPLFSADEDAVIVFNGEIYNHLEIRRELEARGRQFQTHCDTETVLQAFLEWDIDCFSRMRGMFALAIWTKSTQRLVLARDRIGIKPLYIAQRGRDLLFASELKGILIHPEVERRISLEGLDCYLSLNYVPSPWTLVDGIEKLPPGHWLEWRNGLVHRQPYWSVPACKPQAISLEDATAQLDQLMEQSVREHLLSDVPLGIWLSGGVDSSTILHYAAEASGQRLKTFSIGFRGQSFDESPYIRELVQRYDTDHQQLDLDAESDMEDAIRSFAYYSDEPSADSGALPVWFLSQLTRASATVAFSGEGADEIFGGYLTYRANEISRKIQFVPAAGRKLALAALGLWPPSDEKISFEYKAKRLLEGSLLEPARGHVFWNGTFFASSKTSLLRRPLPDALTSVLGALRSTLQTSGDGLSAYLQFDQQTYLPDDILVKSDRMSMAHSIEVRPPFLDHRILEFAATLPADLKIRNSQQKYVLKHLMRNKLPASVLQHGKIGFDIPTHKWFRGPLRSLLMETLTDAEHVYAEFFNFDVIRKMTRRHMDRHINIGYHLWGLMILFLWMKEWNIQCSSNPISAATSRKQSATPSTESANQMLAVEK
jgi:asparagine synthase (glutamine-hydrolysing)